MHQRYVNTRLRRAPIVGLLAIALLATACGSDDDDAAATTSSAVATTSSAAPTTTPGTVADTSPDTTDATTSSAAPTTVPDTVADTSADTTDATTGTSSTDESAGGITPGDDPEVDAVVEAYSTVFDSATTYDDKAPFLPDAESLKATIDGYGAAGAAVGGIALVPTAVSIDGDTATVTYDVQFAGTSVYNDLTGTAVKVGDAWTITTDEFCGFMAEARNPCS